MTFFFTAVRRPGKSSHPACTLLPVLSHPFNHPRRHTYRGGDRGGAGGHIPEWKTPQPGGQSEKLAKEGRGGEARSRGGAQTQ